MVARDIGGNFGTKNSIFPEFPLVLWASRRVGRPVKWVCERSEAFISDYQGRDLVAKIELALDKRGKFLAMRGSHLSNIGAFAASVVPLRKGVTIFSGVYRVPVAHYQALAVVTNTPPTTPYRSAGRPEATFIMERLCDLAAIRTVSTGSRSGAVILSRRTVLPDRLGNEYDNGEYEVAMDTTRTLSD